MTDLSTYFCFCMCAYMFYMCMCVGCVFICDQVRRPEVHTDVFSQLLTTLLFETDVSLNLKFTHSKRLSSKPEECSCRGLASVGITGACPHPSFYIGLGI